MAKFSDYEIAKRFVNKVKDAKDRGLSFSLSLLETHEMFQNVQTCPYSNKTLSKDEVTFERVNPFIGYVSGNVLLVGKDANDAKASLDYFLKNNKHLTMDVKVLLLEQMYNVMLHRKYFALKQSGKVDIITVPKDGFDFSELPDGTKFILIRGSNYIAEARKQSITIETEITHARGVRKIPVTKSVIMTNKCTMIQDRIMQKDATSCYIIPEGL